MNENFNIQQFEYIGVAVLVILIVLLFLWIRFLWCVPTRLEEIVDYLSAMLHANKKGEQIKQLHLADIAHGLCVAKEKANNNK